MIYRAPPIDDYRLTEGVLARRVFAWLVDVLLIGLLLGALRGCCATGTAA